VDHEGKRLFLHRHDLLDKGHLPRKGDSITYVPGLDEKGRTCARSARFHKPRGCLRFRDVILLLFLLVLPGLAALRLPWEVWMTAAYVVAVSFLSFFNYQEDKHRARLDKSIRVSRISEDSLHFLDFIGGWPGGFLGQRQFRHKTTKASYQFVFRTTVFLYQVVPLDYLLGWPGLRWTLAMMAELVAKTPA
jgi:uncharacterized membrane protein YsdA (DUF1294 family)